MKNKTENYILIKKSNYMKLLLGLAVFIFIFLLSFKTAYATPVNEKKLIDLVNTERVKNNLEPLSFNTSLYFSASSKANNMLQDNYFEHYSPSGKSPWDFIKSTDYIYSKAGENLAMDFLTSEGMHNAWMNSPAHEANILDPDFEDIAIASIEGDFNGQETTIVVQMFGKKETNVYKNTLNNFIDKISNLLFGY